MGTSITAKPPSSASQECIRRNRNAASLMRLRAQVTADVRSLDTAWKALSDYYTLLIEDRTGRIDLIAIVSPGLCRDKGAWGFFSPDLLRIVIDGDLLPLSPDQLNPHNDREHFKALSVLHGIFVHEAGHAAHSESDPLISPPSSEAQQLSYPLEEMRMEAQVIRNRPSDAKWLRATIKTLYLKDANKDCHAFDSKLAAVYTATLIEGRIVSGTIKPSDAAPLSGVLDQYFDPDERDFMREVWHEAAQLLDGDQEGLYACAQKLADRFSNGLEKRSAMLAAIGDAVGETLENAEANGLDEVASDEELSDQVNNPPERARTEVSEEELCKQSASRRGRGAAGGDASAKNSRQPTSTERKESKSLAKKLREVMWRDRIASSRRRDVPPGKLIMRSALQRSADIAQGRMTTQRPWNQRRFQNQEMPRIAAGIIVDTSGSMGAFSEEIAASMWIIAHAVKATGGKAMGGEFGNGQEIIFAPGEVPEDVITVRPSGGTDYLPQMLETTDQLMMFDAYRGPKVIFIVTDGCFADTSDRLAELSARGIKIVFIGIRRLSKSHYADEYLQIDSVDGLAGIIGSCCVQLLKES